MPTSASLGAVGELAASRHGVFTRRQAADNELGRMAVTRLRRRGVLDEPVPGVLRVRGAPPTFAQAAYVGALASGGRNLVIAGAAARLHLVDGFHEHPDLHLAIPRGGKLQLAGVLTTQTRDRYDDELDVVHLDHIACSSIARTVCDPARYHPSMFERAADDFQRRGHSLVWLQHTLGRIPRRRGDGLDAVHADIERRLHGGSVRGSWFERLVEACVASPLIPPVERQFEVRSASGEFIARPDLAIPSLRLAIEAHSRRYHTGPGREAFDQRRDNLLAVEGWHTAYVGWADTISSPTAVCSVIEGIVARRALDLGVDLALVRQRR